MPRLCSGLAVLADARPIVGRQESGVRHESVCRRAGSYVVTGPIVRPCASGVAGKSVRKEQENMS